MTAFVCPTCGYANDLTEANTGETTKCTWCGADASNPKSGSLQWPTKFSERVEEKSPGTRKWGIPIVAALGLAIVTVFVFMGSNPAKTPMHELNSEEVDNEILSVGMSALEDHGYTESETAKYIEARIRVYKVFNQRARNSNRNVGTVDDKLNVRSSASDINKSARSVLLKMQEEIEERDVMIKEFERILAEYRQDTQSEQ